MIKSKLYLVISLFYMVAIFYTSSLPIKEFGLSIDPSKLLNHFIAYGLLAISWYLTTLNRNFSFIVSSIYGIADEIHQSFVPFRVADPFDALADVLGAFMFSYFFDLLVRKKILTLKLLL